MRTPLLLICVLFSGLSPLNAQVALPGCTNPFAVNFSPDATEDDGSCENFATTISYNATLDETITIGTGISNERMAIVDHGPIQFGIKANRRFFSDIVPVNDNEYYSQTGYSPESFNDPTPDIGIARWDFIYSFDLGDYTFDDLEAYLIIDFDPLDGATQAPPFELNVSTVLDQLGQSGLSLRQGSENLGFTYWNGLAGPTAALFDPLTPGVYDIGLRLENQGGNTLGEVMIQVIVDEASEGCTDEEACNFDPTANLDDNTCTYPTLPFDCDGNCIHDFDNDGVCDENEVYGCTYPGAINFDAAATDDDSSCLFDSATDLCNMADFDNNGSVNSNDLLAFLSVFGDTCD